MSQFDWNDYNISHHTPQLDSHTVCSSYLNDDKGNEMMQSKSFIRYYNGIKILVLTAVNFAENREL